MMTHIEQPIFIQTVFCSVQFRWLTRFFVAGTIWLLTFSPPTNATPIVEKPEAIVIKLYRDFSSEVVIEAPIQDGLWSQPPKVWGRYFTKEITLLYAKVKSCEKTYAICAREMSPIWYSQLPGGVTIRIRSGTTKSVVVVSIDYPKEAVASGTAILQFKLQQIGSQWRIADIAYPDGTTLSGWLREGLQQ